MASLHPFQISHPSLPSGPPSLEHPRTNPQQMLLCRYPLGQRHHNPNFTLIYSCENPFDEYQDPLYATLTAGSPAPLQPSATPGKKTFWMKTYSENEGLLEQLEAQNILKRTGQKVEQGYVTLIAVETIIQVGQWAEVCSGCERRELLNGGEKRMAKCAKCLETHYCNRGCQTVDWPIHKAVCNTYRKSK